MISIQSMVVDTLNQMIWEILVIFLFASFIYIFFTYRILRPTTIKEVIYTFLEKYGKVFFTFPLCLLFFQLIFSKSLGFWLFLGLIVLAVILGVMVNNLLLKLLKKQ